MPRGGGPRRLEAELSRTDPLARLNARIIECRRCPRLVRWREKVAREKRTAFEDWEYWGRPVPGFGDPRAWLLIVGLAPAAHGANRTGRMFTGDRSGDFLYSALHRAGLANQPESKHRDDGLRLTGAFITAPLRCAPPGNRPRPSERRNCREYFEHELDLLASVRVVLTLGGYAYDHTLRILRERQLPVPSPKPRFRHGLEITLPESGPAIVASYHPSQQNTFTGKLTPGMFDAVLRRARKLARQGGKPPSS